LVLCIGGSGGGGGRARRWEALIDLAGFRVLAAFEDWMILMIFYSGYGSLHFWILPFQSRQCENREGSV